MTAWLVFPPLWLALLVIVGILLSLIWPERRDEWPEVREHAARMVALGEIHRVVGTSSSAAELDAPAAPLGTPHVLTAAPRSFTASGSGQPFSPQPTERNVVALRRARSSRPMSA